MSIRVHKIDRLANAIDVWVAGEREAGWIVEFALDAGWDNSRASQPAGVAGTPLFKVTIAKKGGGTVREAESLILRNPEIAYSRTAKYSFARRADRFDYVASGAIAKAEDSIYLTVTGDSEIPPPPSSTLLDDDFRAWLRDLTARGYKVRGVNGRNEVLDLGI